MEKKAPDEVLDVLVIGGGICGVISLYWAKKRGLKTQLVEKQDGLGGIWRKLPAWQDLQQQAGEWALNGVPLKGILQKDVQENIEAWISRHHLEEACTFRCEVKGLKWLDSFWVVTTSQGNIRAKNVIVASGLHNDPVIPPVEKKNVTLKEFHSAEFPDPSLLKGKRVAILGGGASAFDAIDLALGQGAAEVHWIYRSVRWMIPSTQPKDARPALRVLARNVMFAKSPEFLYEKMGEIIRSKYEYFKVLDLMPPEKFDLRTLQIIPGRPLMIKRFNEIERHQGTIEKIEGNTISVGKESFAADLLIYATGYRGNLRFLGLPEFADVHGTETLLPLCGTYVRALTRPHLFFVGPTILDTNGSTPQVASLLARTIMAHIQGKCVIPETVYREKLVHWLLLDTLAAFDRHNFSPIYRWKYKLKAWYYLRFPRTPIHYP